MQKNRKKGYIVLIAIVVVLLLIGVGFYAYVEFLSKKPVTEEPVTERQQDDRISPLENQGVIIEITRLRHRGLVEKIMKRGTSWRNAPSFYFITNMDDLEYVSKDVKSAGGVNTETLFNTWDTMFLENKIVRDAEEEQKTSEITLTIMEREKTGLLGRRHTDTQRETFTVTYDYKTGRWNGEDSWNDSDGYGHYLGDTFEIWFNIYQTDYDHDGIPYWTEVNVLGTDPQVDDSKLDPDHDGADTAWEWRWGYDPFVFTNHSTLDPDVDGLSNLQEYQMRNHFANPFRRDIYIEADGMQKGGLLDPAHVFWEESQQIMYERFAAHGINLYIDYGWPGNPTNGGGELLQHYDTLSQDSGMMLQYYKNHFSDDRKGIFRYLVIGHNAGFCHPSEYNNYDTMAVDTSLYKAFFKRQAFTPRTQRLVLASAIMHELGHTLGISNWNTPGNDNTSVYGDRATVQAFLDEWGNYKSVMNYYYIWDKTIVDYSDGSHGTNDVNDWDSFDFLYFNHESRVIEDPGFEPPGKEEI